jgi:glycerophosphoryl diester phosphodiesterase
MLEARLQHFDTIEQDAPVQQRLISLRHPPIKFAHRGARAHAQENTIDAFVLALQLGATGLETDVWLTSDGIPILNHGGLLRTGIRRRTVGTFRKEDLPPHIPTLRELYQACGNKFELSIDVKDQSAVEPVIETSREFEAETKLWLCHEDWKVAASWRDSTSAHLVNSTRLRVMKDGPEWRAAELADAGVDAVNLHHTDWTGGLTTLFHRFSRYCIAWDAQHQRIISNLVRMGIDAIHSDHVDRLHEGFDQANR